VPVNGSMTCLQTRRQRISLQFRVRGIRLGKRNGDRCLPASFVTFSADPMVILPGQASTLSWTTTYATDCFIDPGIGAFP